MSAEKRSSPVWSQMASSGFDLAVTIVGFAAVGYWLDRRYGWAPWGVLVGSILGVVGGLVNFLRASLKVRPKDEPKGPDV